MAKKRIVRSDKPTPAKYLLPMDYFNSVLRRTEGVNNIAVRLPAKFNNGRWIKAHFPFDVVKQQDIVKSVGKLLKATNIYADEMPRAFNSRNVKYANKCRYYALFGVVASDLQFCYDTPARDHDIVWWFYSEQSEKPTTLACNFHNHMYYDESIRPAFIIDKWSDGLGMFNDNYIPV